MQTDCTGSSCYEDPSWASQPLELLHSSITADWPGVIVRHYLSHARAGTVALPSVPEPTIVLELSQTQGSGKPLSSSRTLPILPKGKITLIPAGEPAAFQNYNRTEYVQVRILSPLWKKVMADLETIDPGKLTLKAVSQSNDALVEEILLQLLTELQSAGTGSRFYVESLSKALVVHLMRHYTVRPTVTRYQPEALPAYKLKKVQAYMQERLFEKITLNDLSTLIGFSTWHFARLFKTSTGLAPYQYIRKLRMEHSGGLLVETTLPVIQIGFEVGIDNPSHFSSFFKQYTGLTPTAYRKLAG
jgi:AraC family transcriptional regulator